MQTEYPIMFDDKNVGMAVMTRQGMYYRIHCHVSSHVPQPCRVMLRKWDGETDLGLCFRDPQGFALASRVPVKAVGEGGLYFKLYTKQAEPELVFLPVEEEKSFPYLTMLKNARFAVVNSKTGVYIPRVTGKSQDRQGNDQNP